MSRVILQATELKKSFLGLENREILKGVSLTLREGETIAILGPSGSGKSTLLHILGTLESPTEGRLEINGQNAFGKGTPILRNRLIGFIFQNYNLLDDYSTFDNVLMPAKIGKVKGKEQEAKILLKKVGLERQMHVLAKHLSGGEKQRAAIARAFCNDPMILLADEPTGNLDDTNSKRIHDLLLSFVKTAGKGLIVVTHNYALARECETTYTLRHGHLEKGAWTL